MAEGDGHTRNILIEHNLRLVAHIVQDIVNTNRRQEKGILFVVEGCEVKWDEQSSICRVLIRSNLSSVNIKKCLIISPDSIVIGRFMTFIDLSQWCVSFWGSSLFTD